MRPSVLSCCKLRLRSPSTNRLITIQHPWRYIYYVSIALIGGLLVIVIVSFPETCYDRQLAQPAVFEKTSDSPLKQVDTLETGTTRSVPKKRTYWEELKVFRGVYTSESLTTMFLRPLGLIVLPPVLWASLVMSVTIGFLVAVTSNVASAYSTAYDFAAYQTGLCFFAAIIGSGIGILSGGWFGDRVADVLTKRNGGIREPEMRLPAVLISLITTPLGLVIYGIGIENRYHWMVPTLGLGLCACYIICSLCAGISSVC